MGEKGKIPEEAYEDIALMRIQGNTWPTIAKFLKDQYNIEVTNQALSTWYKKNKNTKKTVSIREEYAKEKGDDNVKQELMDLVSNMDRIIEVGLDMFVITSYSIHYTKLYEGLPAYCVFHSF